MADAITSTVTTVTGSRQHLVAGVTDNMLIAALLGKAQRGENPASFLPDPPALYILSNVISITFEDEIPEVIEAVERSMGFAANNVE